MLYIINEDLNLDDYFMFAFNLTMSTGDASPLEGDPTVAQYISFRPKNTPTKWHTVVCETSMNVTAYTGDAKDFKYRVYNYLSKKDGASLIDVEKRDLNTDDGKAVFDGKVESQRDIDSGLFFTKQDTNKKPYTLPRFDDAGVHVICNAAIKLPKFSDDSDGVEKESLVGDLEFLYGVVNPTLAFPADKTKKDESKIGGITYEDETIAAEITKKSETQTQVFFETEQKFDAYETVTLIGTDSAESGKITLKGEVFLSKDETVPARLTMKAEVSVPENVQKSVDK